MIWIYVTRDGKRTGEAFGRATMAEAIGWVEARRWARDNDPVWSKFKHGYDWEIGA